MYQFADLPTVAINAPITTMTITALLAVFICFAVLLGLIGVLWKMQIESDKECAIKIAAAETRHVRDITEMRLNCEETKTWLIKQIAEQNSKTCLKADECKDRSQKLPVNFSREDTSDDTPSY